jgi:hypothetical protein
MRLAESVGRAMKRFLIFLLLGPLLGLLVFMLRNAFAGKIVGGFMASFLGCHLGTFSAFRLYLLCGLRTGFYPTKLG